MKSNHDTSSNRLPSPSQDLGDLPLPASRGTDSIIQKASLTSGWLVGGVPRGAGGQLPPPATSIEKVANWQRMASTHNLTSLQEEQYNGMGGMLPVLGRGLYRGRTPSYEALKGAVTDLYRLDDFNMETLGEGFFSDVYKVVHKTTDKIMVLKMNKYRSNRNNSLREIQLMNRLKHPNILRFEAVCVHEGQLHALTEYISGGNLEQLVKDSSRDLPWTSRMELSLHIAKGLMYLNSQGFFHRDLTSKNILIKKDTMSYSRRAEYLREERGVKLMAVIGDFGLATRIPKKDSPRLPQVGSPYWMSPECLRGERYDQQADIFSFGIVSCELIARCDADPDILPRTQNFGVDYRAFSEMCPSCPPEYLKIAFTCLSIDPSTRPRCNELVSQLKTLLEEYRLLHQPPPRLQPLSAAACNAFTTTGGGGFRRTNGSCSKDAEFLAEIKKSPSEKARIHSRHHLTVKSVGEEMCLKDPHYTPRNSISVNPFALLPRLREGKKLVSSTVDLFSSCFELPSPRVSSPTNPSTNPSRSLPSSPTNVHKEMPMFQDKIASVSKAAGSNPSSSLSSNPRGVGVSNLKKIYSARGFLSQDDSIVGLSSTPRSNYDEFGGGNGIGGLKRWGSVESGVYSVSEDWFSGEVVSSTRSICSSLLTVSDLEEDLRMASEFLARKRSSSVFTDSLDDLSTRLDDLSHTGTGQDAIKALERGYEKDIRDIVEYFERNCVNSAEKKRHVNSFQPDNRSSPEIARSQKIESLILAVAENKTRAARLRRGTSPISPPHLQVCHGIVQSKLQIFDHTKRRQPRPRYEQNGFVKARRAIFDVPPAGSSKGAAVGKSGRKHFSPLSFSGQYFGSKTGAIPKKLLIVPPPTSTAASSSQNQAAGSSFNSQFSSNNVSAANSVSISHRSFELSSGDVTSGSSIKNKQDNYASYSSGVKVTDNSSLYIGGNLSYNGKSSSDSCNTTNENSCKMVNNEDANSCKLTKLVELKQQEAKVEK